MQNQNVSDPDHFQMLNRFLIVTYTMIEIENVFQPSEFNSIKEEEEAEAKNHGLVNEQ